MSWVAWCTGRTVIRTVLKMAVTFAIERIYTNKKGRSRSGLCHFCLM
jgi:hypothetical protein